MMNVPRSKSQVFHSGNREPSLNTRDAFLVHCPSKAEVDEKRVTKCGIPSGFIIHHQQRVQRVHVLVAVLIDIELCEQRECGRQQRLRKSV